MKMRKLIYVFGLFFILACEKEATKYDFPITLLSSEYRITSGLKIFTKGGQITDNFIINNYLVADSLFYSRTDTIIQTNGLDTLIYKCQDTVLFPEPDLWGKRIPKKNGNYIYFYLTDTLIGYRSAVQYSEMKDIINQIGIYKPFYEDYGDCAPSTGSPLLLQRIYNARIAEGTPAYLEFPLLNYKLTRTRSNFKGFVAQQNYNNVFDENVINLLEDGDTLAIQEAKIIYKAVEK